MKTFFGESDPTGLGQPQDVPSRDPSLGKYADDTGWSRRARQVLSIKLRYLSPDVKWAGSKVLVLQCESGLMADGLVRRGCEVTAVDTRSYMVDVARTRSRSNGYLINYLHVDELGALPFADGGFDIVLCDHVFERSRNRSRTLKEVARVLRPGGRLLYSTVNSSLRTRIYSMLCPVYLMPGMPQSISPLCPVRPARMRRLLKSNGFEPGRFGGLRLKLFSLFGEPDYRVRRPYPTIYLGCAERL